MANSGRSAVRALHWRVSNLVRCSMNIVHPNVHHLSICWLSQCHTVSYNLQINYSNTFRTGFKLKLSTIECQLDFAAIPALFGWNPYDGAIVFHSVSCLRIGFDLKLLNYQTSEAIRSWKYFDRMSFKMRTNKPSSSTVHWSIWWSSPFQTVLRKIWILLFG